MSGETPEETAERHRKMRARAENPVEAVATPAEAGEFTALWRAARRPPATARREEGL
jgi:hypothetical protein